MKKLRQDFWEKADEFIAWCDDDELRVLVLRPNRALEERLGRLLKKQDNAEMRAKSKRGYYSKLGAIKAQKK